MKKRSIRLPPLANFLGCTASENVSSKNVVMTLCWLFATSHHWTIVVSSPAFSILFSSAIWRASSSTDSDRELETASEKKKVNDERSISCFNTRSNKYVCSILLLQQHAIYIFAPPYHRGIRMQRLTCMPPHLRNPSCQLTLESPWILLICTSISWIHVLQR